MERRTGFWKGELPVGGRRVEGGGKGKRTRTKWSDVSFFEECGGGQKKRTRTKWSDLSFFEECHKAIQKTQASQRKPQRRKARSTGKVISSGPRTEHKLFLVAWGLLP